MKPHPGDPYRTTGRYEKIPEQEEFLDRINTLLRPADDAFAPPSDATATPLIFVVGTPRSGSTLLAQLLPSALELGHVSNLMARFHGVPSVGARLQRMLLKTPRCETDFAAEHGLTSDPESTHEFGYFWRRWFPFDETHQVSQEQLARTDIAGLQRELAVIAAVFGAPVVFKNLILGLHIPSLMSWLKAPLFVDLERCRDAVAHSILRARRESPGGESEWWSLRPPEYTNLRELEPREQIAGQILSTRLHIEEALAQIPSQNRIRVTYEELCNSPRGVVARLRGKLEDLGHPVDCRVEPPAELVCRNRNVDRKEEKAFQVAFEHVEGHLDNAKNT